MAFPRGESVMAEIPCCESSRGMAALEGEGRRRKGVPRRAVRVVARQSLRVISGGWWWCLLDGRRRDWTLGRSVAATNISIGDGMVLSQKE
jgi:hypothetical protein